MPSSRLRWPALLITLAILLIHLPAFSRAAAAPADLPTQIPGRDAILVGVAWYPEQWPESRWEKDLELMEAAHIKVVRVAEFAWSAMEPSEGHYDFGWLERAVALAAKHHIVTVLGTPTAAPPAWLTSKYPDTLRIEPDGQRAKHGNRAQESPTSPRYLEFCREIAQQMAMHFGHNPDVAGWQIDNEYSYAVMSYDEDTRKQFQDWLKTRYKTLASLNDHWTTSYWSQTYDDWSEIPIPVGENNPGLMLAWKRFTTYAWNNYQKNQIDVIHKYADPRQFVTGNLMGFWDGVDHYPLTEPLTFASWDDYVGQGQVDPAHNGMTHDLTRGFKRENFWVMETQPGAVNWAPVNNFLNKGEARAMAWQAIGHGSDAVSYWQWRSALNGQEEYHGTLLGPDGTPVPFYSEVQQTGADFEKAQEAFRGTSVVSQVALLNSYDSRWAIEFQKHNENYDYVKVLESYYRPLYRLAQSVDIVSPYAPLDSYKLVVAPDLNVMPQDMADHLLAYVRQGGHLLLGPRSGMKDEFNALLTQRQPGYLVDALGGRVEQYYALDKDVPVSGDWGAGKGDIWAEQMSIRSSETKVLMRYGKSNGWLDDQPAVITRPYGKGSITYIGALLDDNLMKAAAEWMVKQSGVEPAFGAVPDGVWVSRRVGDGKTVFVMENFGGQAQHVQLPHAMQRMLAGGEAESVDLPQYGVAVLLEKK